MAAPPDPPRTLRRPLRAKRPSQQPEPAHERRALLVSLLLHAIGVWLALYLLNYQPPEPERFIVIDVGGGSPSAVLSEDAPNSDAERDDDPNDASNPEPSPNPEQSAEDTPSQLAQPLPQPEREQSELESDDSPALQTEQPSDGAPTANSQADITEPPSATATTPEASASAPNQDVEASQNVDETSAAPANPTEAAQADANPAAPAEQASNQTREDSASELSQNSPPLESQATITPSPDLPPPEPQQRSIPSPVLRSELTPSQAIPLPELRSEIAETISPSELSETVDTVEAVEPETAEAETVEAETATEVDENTDADVNAQPEDRQELETRDIIETEPNENENENDSENEPTTEELAQASEPSETTQQTEPEQLEENAQAAQAEASPRQPDDQASDVPNPQAIPSPEARASLSQTRSIPAASSQAVVRSGRSIPSSSPQASVAPARSIPSALARSELRIGSNAANNESLEFVPASGQAGQAGAGPDAPQAGAPAKDFSGVLQRPVTVMLDNTDNGYPQTGLQTASLIVEAPVSSTITRLMALYSQEDASQVGPVRSTREFFVDFSARKGAILVHAGGSIEALSQIADSGQRTLDSLARADIFRRIERGSVPYEYTLFSDGQQIRQVLSNEGLEQREQVSISGYTPPEDAPSLEAVSVSIYDYETGFRYQPLLNQYRWQRRGQPASDTSGAVLVDAVLIARINASVVDGGTSQERLRVPSTSGRARLLINGKAVAGTWNSQDGLSFIDEAGTSVSLTPLRTWVIFVPPWGDVRE